MRVIEGRYEVVVRGKSGIAGAKREKRNGRIFGRYIASHTEPQLARASWVGCSGRAMKDISLCVASAVSTVQRLVE